MRKGLFLGPIESVCLKRESIERFLYFKQNIFKNMKNTDRKFADFTGISIFSGIDSHRKSWRVTIRTQNTELKIMSMDPSPKLLADHLRKNYPGGIYYAVYEAGYFGFWIARELISLGIKCMVVNPADIPTMNKEKDQKEDGRDSRKLARELSSGSLVGIYIPPFVHEADRDLVRRRGDIVTSQTKTKNQIKAMLERYDQRYPGEEKGHWSRAYIQWLETMNMGHESANLTLKSRLRSLQEASAHIRDHNRLLRSLAKEERYAHQIKLLKEIPSVGPVTSMVLLSELGDVKRFKTLDALCSFVGLVPSTKSSGERERVGRMSNRGNAHIKAVLIECAWVARRQDPALALCYENLVKRMKGQKAIIRIAKKLLSKIRHVLLHKESYVIGLVA